MGCIWSNVDLAGGGLRIRTIRHLTQGGFSNILLCEDIDSCDKYAVKMIASHSKYEEDRIFEEVKMHRRFSEAQNIVPLLAVIGSSGDSAFYLVFPLYKKGTVADELGKRRKFCEHLDQITVVRLFSGLCSAVDHMHTMGYAHRDLKTANILLTDDGRAMLTDFGSSTSVPISINSSYDQQRMRDEAAELCSMPYRAPELFDCYVGTSITTDVDLWSLGCCLYAMCFFASPFDLIYEKGDSIALAVQSPEKISYPDNAPYDSELVSLIKCLLVVNPSERLPLSDIFKKLDTLTPVVSNNTST